MNCKCREAVGNKESFLQDFVVSFEIFEAEVALKLPNETANSKIKHLITKLPT